MLVVIGWILLVASALGLVLWISLAARVERTLRHRPTVRAGLALPPPSTGWPTVSVVVPAYNEERVIDRCLASLRSQTYDDLEIIFVLDRCTDDTLTIARRHAAEDERIIIIENETCPPDWAGKCNAAHRGGERARGRYLLFTDADTIFHKDLVRASVALAEARELSLVSLLSTLTFDHLYECVAQPVATMSLIQMYPIELVNRREGARPFANGQFMLFRRDAYEAIGGHTAVQEDLLEDIAFARKIHANGGQGAIYLADGMLVCSMYDSLEAFRTGWRRIFIEACKRKVQRLRKHAFRVFMMGIGQPLLQITTLVVGSLLITRSPRLGVAMIVIVAAAIVAQLLTLARIYNVGGAPRRAALLFPVGCWIVGSIFLQAADDLVRRRPIRWAGKQYVLEPRDA